jgi:hypothetical protein
VGNLSGDNIVCLAVVIGVFAFFIVRAIKGHDDWNN